MSAALVRPGAPTPSQQLVAALLRDLVVLRSWRLALPGCRSPLGYQLDALRAGALGDGCSGTRGAGGREAPEPSAAVPLSHPLDDRYRSLARAPGHAVRALLVEGHSTRIDTPARVLYGADLGAGPRVEVELTVEQAVGWWATTTRQRAAWAARVLDRDRAPALAGMTALGEAVLLASAREWCHGI